MTSILIVCDEPKHKAGVRIATLERDVFGWRITPTGTRRVEHLRPPAAHQADRRLLAEAPLSDALADRIKLTCPRCRYSVVLRESNAVRIANDILIDDTRAPRVSLRALEGL